MRYFLLFLVNTTWALWFGGTIATFVFGLNLFHTHPDIAGAANSSMFVVFSRYELILAGIAVLATGMLLVTYPAKTPLAILAALIVAGGMAITVSLGLIPHMEALREQGKQHTDEFKKYHGKSMMAMTMQSAMLLLGGAAIVAAGKPWKAGPAPQATAEPVSEYEPMFDDRNKRQL